MYLRVLENRSRNARPNRRRRTTFDASHLEIRMFNAWHGEAVLVISDDERAWLMDCGTNSIPRNILLGEGIVDYLQVQNLVLDTIVLSHPNFDHAGAVETILDSPSPHIANPVTIYRTDINTNASFSMHLARKIFGRTFSRSPTMAAAPRSER